MDASTRFVRRMTNLERTQKQRRNERFARMASRDRSKYVGARQGARISHIG